MFGYIVRNREQILYFSKCLLTNYLYHFMNNQPSFSNEFFSWTSNSAPQFHVLLLGYYHSAFSTVGFKIYLTNWLFKLFFFFFNILHIFHLFST